MAAVATTGGSSHASREARRRRILERGSDRLALITGRIDSLPPDPDQSPSLSTPASQTPADSAQHEDVAPSPSLQNQESVIEPTQNDTLNDTVKPLPLPQHNENGQSFATRAANLLGVEEQIFNISSSMRNRSRSNQHELQSHRPFLTASQISSAVAASENIRMCFSITAAILVILSCTRFPFLAGPVVRPVYLLLLTNISVVFAWVFLGKSGVESRMGRSRVSNLGGNGLVDQLGKAIGSALLLQKIFSALFIDFSVYAVVLVCGLCLVRGLGW